LKIEWKRLRMDVSRRRMSFRDGDLSCRADIAMVCAFKTSYEEKWIKSIQRYWEAIHLQKGGWSKHMAFFKIWSEFGKANVIALGEVEFFQAVEDKFKGEFPDWMCEYAQLRLAMISRCWRKDMHRVKFLPIERFALTCFEEEKKPPAKLQPSLKERILFFDSLGNGSMVN
jgi:hypothetical protein